MGCDVACLQMQNPSVVQGRHGASVGSLHYNRIARCNEEGDTVDTSWTLAPNGTTTPSATWDAETTLKRWLCLYLEENAGSPVKHWQILSRKDVSFPGGETVVMTEVEYATFKNHFEHVQLAQSAFGRVQEIIIVPDASCAPSRRFVPPSINGGRFRTLMELKNAIRNRRLGSPGHLPSHDLPVS